MEEMILQDICKIYDCPHTTAKDEGLGIPLVRTPNVGKGRLILTNVHRVNSDVYKERTLRAIPEEDDIIIAREAPVGNAAIIQKKQKVCLGQRVVLLKPNKTLVDPNFLVYHLLSNDVQHLLKIQANGAVVAHLNVADIRNLSVHLPSLCEQKKIGKLLKIIDDKIELNRRINDNLEQQAQALFKSWKEEGSDNAWSRVKLDSIADFFNGYSYKGSELKDSVIAMATIKNFDRNKGFKHDGYKEIVPSEKIKESQYAKMCDILVAHTDLTQNAEVIGNAEMILDTAGYSQIIFSMDLVKVLPKKQYPYKYVLAAILRDPEFKAHSLGYVNGTTVLHLSKKTLPEYLTIYPEDKTVLKTLDEKMKSIYLKILELQEENQKLEVIRDTILPKLMSGELQINEINS